MLIYSYKGKKCLSHEIIEYYSFDETLNYKKIWNYFDYIRPFGLAYGADKPFEYDNNGRVTLSASVISRHLYRTYTTLCKLNNLLVNTYFVDDEFIAKIDFVFDYLQNNTDVKESFDIQCRKIYDKLNNWYYRLTNNYDSLDTIKWEVVKVMKYYEKKEIFRIASINLKRNYYDFYIE